jgi:hypothetical protein
MIPKKNDPEELKDYKPIGLCNVVYKVSLNVWLIASDIFYRILFHQRKVHLSMDG